MFRKTLFMFGALILTGATGVWAADGMVTQIGSEEPPQIITVSPTADASIPACRYPKFEAGGTDDNPTCAAKLRSSAISLAPRSGTCPSAYETVLGMEKDVAIPAAYRGTATVMVNWTLRVEGVSSPVNPWTEGLCSPWHGTSIESFPGGKVSTRILVNNKALGLPADMTLPDSGIVQVTNTSDPTISGSYVVKPTDFQDGQLPATLNVKVQWNNDTCMVAKSQDGFRSMVITMVPQGNQ